MALQAVMARSGYARATIAEISRQAGLAPGLVHYYFRDKREILVALVEALASYARSRFDKRAVGCTRGEDRLRAYIDAHLAYGADAQPDAVAAWVMVSEQALHDPDVREVYQGALREQIKLLKGLLRMTLAERGLRARRLDALAAGVTAFIQGTFSLATTARPLLPPGFAAPMLTLWLERYLTGEHQQ